MHHKPELITQHKHTLPNASGLRPRHRLLTASCALLTRHSHVPSSLDPRERMAQRSTPCKRCVHSEHIWKQSLTSQSHGCGACKNVFKASCWSANLTKAHQSKNHDLVCPDCKKRGYASGKYTDYQCEDCGQMFGCKKFKKHVLQNAQRQTTSRRICIDCAQKLRCCSCKIAYHQESWTKTERNNHKAQGTKLVCKSCRAAGFRPCNVTAFKCQTCECLLGSKKFDSGLLRKHTQGKGVHLRCLECSERKTKHADVHLGQPNKSARLAVHESCSVKGCNLQEPDVCMAARSKEI